MSEETRWRAVEERDRSQDFVYGVITTGVFCRPGCPSRRPNRENVRFFDHAMAALDAGFRACKRCRPAGGEGASDVVRTVCSHIEASEGLPSMADLARVAGCSEGHVHRVFKAATGLTPHQWARGRRAERAREGLRSGAPVTDAILEAGFTSTGRFYEEADGFLGMTPTRFRAGGDGLVIVWVLGDCSLGRVLVAGTPRGVCAVLLGDDDGALLRELASSFPRAELVAAPDSARGRLAEVVGGIDSSERAALPLDLRGTAFQMSVWRALTEVPPGATVSYAELAERVGRPTAARAVAAACAANRVAVYVPCHRVVRSDGSLAGYRWGVERKAALLSREQQARDRPA